MFDNEFFGVFEVSFEGLGDVYFGLFVEIDGDVCCYFGCCLIFGYKFDVVQVKVGVVDQDVFQCRWCKWQCKEFCKLFGKFFEIGVDDQIIWGCIGEGGRVGYLCVEGMGGFGGDDESYEGEVVGVQWWFG